MHPIPSQTLGLELYAGKKLSAFLLFSLEDVVIDSGFKCGKHCHPDTIEHLMDLNCSSLIIFTVEGARNNTDGHVEFSLWRCYAVKEYDELIEATHSQNTLVLLNCVL